jgi:transcriptional regulator
MTEKPYHKIMISEIINSPLAVSTEKGDQVFNHINRLFELKEKADLDFQGLTLIVSTFLNAAVGQLYGFYGSEYVQQNLKISNLPQDNLVTLKLVTDRAKKYFANKEAYDKHLDKDFPNAE